MSSSNCCFLTCIQVSQEAGQVVWYSHLFQNFPQFTVIHTVKGFGIVNKGEMDVFLDLSCFSHDPLLLIRFSHVRLCDLTDPIDQPTRLLHPWDFPGKNTGVCCHFLLQCMKVKSDSEVTQLCPTLSDPMDCGPPGSCVHGIFQARVLEWGAIALSTDVGNLISVPLPFLNPAWTSGSSQFTYCWSLALRILSITLLVCEM